MNTPLRSGLSSSLHSSLHSQPVFDFLPSDVAGLKLWTRFNSGITVTGSGVSQWDDVSGNGNHLKQGTDTNRPSKEADGSILFDGVDNLLKADAFTWVQPEEVFILFKHITWTINDYVWDGNTAASMAVTQRTTTPNLAAYAGSFSSLSSDLPLDTYGVMRAAYNGASSSFQIDNTTEITGDFGASNAAGFTLAANGSGAAFSNIQVKEVIGYGATLTTAQRLQIINYLLSL